LEFFANYKVGWPTAVNLRTMTPGTHEDYEAALEMHAARPAGTLAPDSTWEDEQEPRPPSGQKGEPDKMLGFPVNFLPGADPEDDRCFV
jgi:hypothetical protein